jgi:hypothetical protein
MRRIFALFLLVAGLAACSLTLDTDKKQCTKNEDCAEPYACNTGSGLCMQPKCAVDSDCTNGICERSLCSPKQCNQAVDCDDGERCDPAGRCAEAECSSNDQCGPLSTELCVGGSCVDELWGCRDQGDERPAPTMDKATYVLKVYKFPGGDPIDGLEVQVCASVDAACVSPLAGPTVDIAADGTVTIGNLPQNHYIHLLLTGPGIYSTHYYSQRPVRDVGGEVVDLGIVASGLLAAVATPTGVPVDTENNGTLLARVFNCKGEGGEGVTFQVSEVQQGTEVFYSESDFQPNANLQATSSGGVFAVANMKPGMAIRVSGEVEGQDVTAQTVTALPDFVTVVNFYPRNYGN